MPGQRELTREEEKRCVRFLKQMGIDRPDHRFLSDRGYFGIFLSGLNPSEVKMDGAPLERREFQEHIRLLAIAGVDRLRDLIRERIALGENKPTPRPPGKAPPERRETPAPPPPAPDAPLRHGSTLALRELHAIRPNESERERLRRLERAELPEEAIAYAGQHLRKGEYHEAYHILVSYLLQHEVSEDVLREATNIILRASQYDRSQGTSPENMLYECEEMAAILSRRIPEMSRLHELRDKDLTQRIYRFVRLVYKTWSTHCLALLEYKYTTTDGQLVRRNWIEPRDFGFLVELMRLGVQSRLPLDLLQFIYDECRKCVALGSDVIAIPDKQAKFVGDVLRIIASPTRDVIPDMTFAIFRDIVNAYLQENDTENALIFCKQALMIKKYDHDMLMMKKRLEEQGASRMKSSSGAVARFGRSSGGGGWKG